MSKSVDERIVDLQFNNKQFESNVADTIKSLQNLEKGLKLDGATKGLEDINKASKNFSIAGIADGVDHMASKFTAMSLVAITAIQNVVNKCIDAGVQIAKSLTLDPIMDGFREYETKMGAITTILTNTADKGTTLSDVTASLNELNEYADKTVYNFGQMTNSIGRFTANGVALDDSVKAIKGLANIAAGAGSNTMQMNSAMIQLSQSISNNRLMLQDWNSVVNAGMGGPVLQNMLMEAAVAAGEMDASLMNAVKNGEVGFRRLLDMGSTGFGIQFSRETMLAAFTQAAEDETLIKAATQVKTASQLMETMAESVGSSWATTWELVFGHRDQAIKLFTSINDSFGVMIQSSNDARNEALSFWNTYGGRDAMIEALANAFKALMSIIKPIGDAFKEIFPPLTGQRLAAFSKNLRDITRQFKVSDDMSDKLKRTFKGLFALVDIGIKIFGGFVKVAVGILKVLAPVGSGLLGFAAGIGDFIVAIRDAVSAGDIFNTVFGGIRTFLDKVADGIGKAIGKISDYFSQFGVIDLGPLRIFSKEVKVQFRPFTFIAEVMSKAFEAIKKVFEKVIPYFVKFGTAIGKAFAKIGEVVKAAANYLGFDSIGELVMSILKGGLLVGLMGLIDRIKSIVDSAGGFLSGITGILDGVRGSLEAFQSSLKAKALMSIAIAIGILAGALWVLATIPGRDLMTALGGITVLFGELSGVMLLMSHNIGSIKMGGIALQMIAISGAILILSFAMKNIADIGWENIAKGTLAIGAMMTMLVVAAKILGSNTETVIKGSFGMLMFSTSILILSQSLMLLSGLSWGELAGGLAGIGGLILELAVFMNLMGDGSGILKTGAAMILLGAGILVLAQAVKSMSGMSWEELGKGLTGLAGSLLIIAGVSKLVKPSQILALGAAMVGISAGLVVISLALSIMGGMEWEAIGKGLVAIGGSLLMIVAVAKLVNPVQLLAMAVALTIVSVALNLIGIALKIMGSMSWEQLAIGLIAMAGALIILAGAMYLMTGGLVGVAAMLVMAAAMMILVPALVLLGSMDLANVGIMLLALVGVFVIFAAAAILLTPVIPLMLLLAAALALLGGGMLALGSGMALLSGAMIVFAGAGAAGIAVLVEVVTSMIKLIPMAVDNIGKGLVLLLYRISEAIPQIVSIFREIFKGLLELFDEMLPPTVEAFYSFLEQMSQTLLDHVPQMVDNGMKLLVGVLKGIADNIDQVTQLSLKVVEEYLKGLTAGMPGVAKEGANLIIAFLKAMGEEVPRVIDAATQ
ncbi:MAG: tape measure protein, partial [Eubacterium sp.]|nr:tape measure protein [Eubacterium sp.]